MISIIIPSYGRPERALSVWANASANTHGDVEIIFVVEEEQYDSYVAALKGGNGRVLQNTRSKNYAGAVNSAISWIHPGSSLVFLGADDLNFHRAWNGPAEKVMYALPHIQVVGTNDLLNGYVLQGMHATHYLINREYIDEVGGVVDGDKGHVLFEGYDHNFTDTEFIGTAKARAVFAPCLDSVVEHKHFSITQENDDTSAKTMAHLQDDADLYYSRRHLWWDLSK